MPQIDPIDQKLIALLSHDGRASITTLAGGLGIARATVQKRLATLVANGTIHRFTVELGDVDTEEAIRAVMLIELQGPLARSVIAQLKRIPQISGLNSTNGAWDLVAHLESRSLSEFDTALRAVREIKGVLNSQTCLYLSREW